MKKYPRYFSIDPVYSKEYGYKYIRVDTETSFGVLVCSDGSGIITSLGFKYLEETHEEIPMYEAVLM